MISPDTGRSVNIASHYAIPQTAMIGSLGYMASNAAYQVTYSKGPGLLSSYHEGGIRALGSAFLGGNANEGPISWVYRPLGWYYAQLRTNEEIPQIANYAYIGTFIATVWILNKVANFFFNSKYSQETSPLKNSPQLDSTALVIHAQKAIQSPVEPTRQLQLEPKSAHADASHIICQAQKKVLTAKQVATILANLKASGKAPDAKTIAVLKKWLQSLKPLEAINLVGKKEN